MAKQSKSFRLSDQAQENLRLLVKETGSSETALVEIALAFLVKAFRASSASRPVSHGDKSSYPPEPDPPDDWR